MSHPNNPTQSTLKSSGRLIEVVNALYYLLRYGMNIRTALFISFFTICGFVPAYSFADDKFVLLEPFEKYSYCTPWGAAGYELGIVGKNWALTFEIPENSLSGKVEVKKVRFHRGPDMYKYIGKPAGPVRPSIPETEAYTMVELAGIIVDIQRVKVYDKVMGPIEVVVSDFSSDGLNFRIPGRVNILCFGPLP